MVPGVFVFCRQSSLCQPFVHRLAEKPECPLTVGSTHNRSHRLEMDASTALARAFSPAVEALCLILCASRSLSSAMTPPSQPRSGGRHFAAPQLSGHTVAMHYKIHIPIRLCTFVCSFDLLSRCVAADAHQKGHDDHIHAQYSPLFRPFV